MFKIELNKEAMNKYRGESVKRKSKKQAKSEAINHKSRVPLVQVKSNLFREIPSKKPCFI